MEAERIRERMPAIIAGEVAAINKTFAGRTLDAGTRAGWTVVAGRSYIAYGLRLRGGATAGRGETTPQTDGSAVSPAPSPD